MTEQGSGSMQGCWSGSGSSSSRSTLERASSKVTEDAMALERRTGFTETGGTQRTRRERSLHT